MQQAQKTLFITGGVAQTFIEYEISSTDGRASLLFGGIGALIGFFYAVRSN